jgi:hypothetical protein
MHKTKTNLCFICLRLVYGGVQHILCYVLCFVCLRLVHGGVQHITRQRQKNIKHNTRCVDYHHTQGQNKQNIKHNTICVEHHHTQDKDKQNIKHNQHILCYVLCFICLRLVYGGVQHIVCYVLCFICLFVLCMVVTKHKT